MKALDYLLIGAIRAYRLFLVPILPMSCRYWPSCSHYAGEAVARHGAARGAWLAVGRVLRCNPWGGLGLDPVPDRFTWGAAFKGAAPSGTDQHPAAREGTPSLGHAAVREP